MVAANGGSWRFMVGVQGQRVVGFWSAEDRDAFSGGDQTWGWLVSQRQVGGELESFGCFAAIQVVVDGDNG